MSLFVCCDKIIYKNNAQKLQGENELRFGTECLIMFQTNDTPSYA